MRSWAFALSAGMLAAQPVAAQDRAQIDISAGTLKSAVDALARQTASSIAIADPALARLRVRSIRGRMTAETALRRMVAGLPLQVQVIDSASFRLARAPEQRRPPTRRHSPDRRNPRIAPSTPPGEIVVTASKRNAPASQYPLVTQIVTFEELRFDGASGTEAIARATTSLSSTHLGQGRDKLFLRGVADSSFTGHTQGTVGQYLGEARLNYSGPDPDIRLYDVGRVELMPGPQGTLYGAGSLGGIIRAEPNPPDPTAFGAEAMLSASHLQGGNPGAEASAMLNLPIGWRKGALRLVAYRLDAGGYIDQLGSDRRNANALSITGARAAIDFEPAEGWHAGIMRVGQDIKGADAGYADRRQPGLARRSAVAEPYATRFGLASFTLRHDGRSFDLVTNLGYARARLADVFDASGPLPDTLFLARRDASDVLSGEARISHTVDAAVTWLAGTSFVSSQTRFASALHYRDGSMLEAAAATKTAEQILFGEATFTEGPAAITLGARAARWYSRSRTSDRSGTSAPLAAEARGWRLLPSVSALVTLSDRLQLILRRASSYRPPTAAASPGGARILRSDRYAAWDVGVRLSPSGVHGISGTVSLSSGRWRDVQADVIDNSGYLSAANVGDARILSLEMMARWQLSDRFRIDGSATINSTSLMPRQPGIINIDKGQLPNVPAVNAQLALTFQSPDGSPLPYRAATRFRYVGHSRLGAGPELDRRQGGFPELDTEISVERNGLVWLLSVTNLLGASGNRFALGSLAQAGSNDLFVPQQPRMVRLGLKIGSRRDRDR